MAFRLIYDPAYPGSIQVDNNTTVPVPYAQGQVYPIWDLTGDTITLQNNHYDKNAIFGTVGYAGMTVSSDGGATFTTPASMAALIAWVKQYCFEQANGGGGGGNVTITSPIGQQPMAQSVSVAIASDQSLVTVGGKTAIPAIVALDVATTIYAANQCLGGVQHFHTALRTNGGTATFDAMSLVDYDNQKAPIDIYFFSQNPNTGAYADQTACSPNATDWANVVRKVSIASTDYTSVGTGAGQFATVDLSVHKAVINTMNTTDIYFLMVVQGTPTYASGNLTIKASFYQD